MAGGGGRRLRPWLLAQLESGRFAGLVWDDAGRSALRIPWQHAGKAGARGGAGTALCQAWAEFKGRLRPGARPDPAGWKTRLRCALNKSPEFQEVPARSRLEGPRPYKVYRLLPPPPPRGGRGPPRARQQRQQRGGEEEEEEEEEEEGGAEDPGPTAGEGAQGPPQAPPPSPPEPAEAPPPDEAPPPEPLRLALVVDSPQPLPPAEGPWGLGLRVWLWGSLAWQGRLPPGEYLLAPPPAGPAPRPGLLPRLRPLAPPGAPPALRPLLAGLQPGLLVASARRGLFLRRRPGAPLHCRAPHAQPHGGALPHGRLLLAFDAARFREELSRHRAGLGPLPEHRVTLAVGQELGPQDGPHNRSLVLQLEQAFAQQLLDAAPPSQA